MITTAACNSFKQEVEQGIHGSGDTYKIALYTSAATLDKNTTAYSATNEVASSGYTAGGKILSGYSAGLSGDIASLDWSDPSWTLSTITARGCLIYNATQGNKAVCVFNFGSDVVSSNGTFTVQFPAPVVSFE